jgi:hypothetical protein
MLGVQGKLENRKLHCPYWFIYKIIQVGRRRAVSYALARAQAHRVFPILIKLGNTDQKDLAVTIS